LKLNDLKNGMELKLRNGFNYFLIKGEIISIPNITRFTGNAIATGDICILGDLGEYKNDFTHRFRSEYDIMKIYLGEQLIWERVEVEFLNNLKFGDKIEILNEENKWTKVRFIKYDEFAKSYYVYNEMTNSCNFYDKARLIQ